MDINLYNIFMQIIQPATLIILIAGVAIGIIIGAIPGLTPTMGVALFVPFTFKMTPVLGLIFLGAIFIFVFQILIKDGGEEDLFV